ncbi:unnamed protein product, partial [Prorocentrum cordatum]
MAPGPPELRVLRGLKMPFWGCSCGRDNKLGIAHRVLLREEYNGGLEEQLRALTKQMASLAQRPSSTAPGGPAAGGGGSIRKGHDDGDKNAFHQKAVLQANINYHEKAFEERSK